MHARFIPGIEAEILNLKQRQRPPDIKPQIIIGDIPAGIFQRILQADDFTTQVGQTVVAADNYQQKAETHKKTQTQRPNQPAIEKLPESCDLVFQQSWKSRNVAPKCHVLFSLRFFQHYPGFRIAVHCFQIKLCTFFFNSILQGVYKFAFFHTMRQRRHKFDNHLSRVAEKRIFAPEHSGIERNGNDLGLNILIEESNPGFVKNRRARLSPGSFGKNNNRTVFSISALVSASIFSWPHCRRSGLPAPSRRGESPSRKRGSGSIPF